MKIIITEEQLENLTNENLKQSLFKYWDIQKKKGNKPKLDDIVFGIANVKKHSSEDHKLVRPIWYEYNGGINKLMTKLKKRVKNSIFDIEGDFNLKIKVGVETIAMDGDVFIFRVTILQGTVDYEFYDEDSGESKREKNADIFYVYSHLEYDSHDFTQFLEDSIWTYFDSIFDDLDIPLDVEINL